MGIPVPKILADFNIVLKMSKNYMFTKIDHQNITHYIT